MNKPISLSQHKSSSALNLSKGNKLKDLSGINSPLEQNKSKKEVSSTVLSPIKRKNFLANIHQSSIFLSSKTIVQSPRSTIQLKLNRTTSETEIEQLKRDASPQSPKFFIPSLQQANSLKRITSPGKQALAKLDFLIKSKPSKQDHGGALRLTASEKTMTM